MLHGLHVLLYCVKIHLELYDCILTCSVMIGLILTTKVNSFHEKDFCDSSNVLKHSETVLV